MPRTRVILLALPAGNQRKYSQQFSSQSEDSHTKTWHTDADVSASLNPFAAFDDIENYPCTIAAEADEQAEIRELARAIRSSRVSCSLATSADAVTEVTTENDVNDPHLQTVIVVPLFSQLPLENGSLHRLLSKRAGNRSYNVIGILFFSPPTASPHLFQGFADIVVCNGNDTENSNRIRDYFSRYAPEKSGATPTSHQLETFFGLNFVGNSPAYFRILSNIIKISQCDVPVHIHGETGTGKEMVARALHYFGERRDKGFIPLNCAAIPDSLFESELFGHEKGAFTNASGRHIGLVELADEGTLFLDEVDSLSDKAQSALLRFLQTGEYRPVGSNRLKHAKTRIISATNAVLSEKVDKGSFREDLMFRLNVLNISIPPLRERASDILVIADHLIKRFSNAHKKGVKILHPDYITWLQQQEWHGNVRELENQLLRDYLLQEGNLIRAGQIDGEDFWQSPEQEAQLQSPWPDKAPHSVDEPLPPTTHIAYPDTMGEVLHLSYQDAKEIVMESFTARYIRSMLNRTGGNVTRAASLAGKERRAFGKLVKKYGIDKTECI